MFCRTLMALDGTVPGNGSAHARATEKKKRKRGEEGGGVVTVTFWDTPKR